MLTLQRQNAEPFLASADCVITYPKDGKDRKEPVRGGRIAFVPEDKVYFKGELVFKELRFGTNESEFWLRIKADLDDFGDSYWWGRRADVQRCPETLPVHPGCVAEALGVVEVTTDWSLSHRDGHDILTLVESGVIKKRVTVNACDYLIEEIEYFDTNGMRRVSVALSEYSTEDGGILTPTHIEMVSIDRLGLPELTVLFELKNIRPLPPEKQKTKLFTRPERDGYGAVYRLNQSCEFVKEEDE